MAYNKFNGMSQYPLKQHNILAVFPLLPKLRQLLGVSLDELICGLDGQGGTENPADHTLRTMNEDEAALLKAFRRLSPKRRKGLLDMLG